MRGGKRDGAGRPKKELMDRIYVPSRFVARIYQKNRAVARRGTLDWPKGRIIKGI